jgi:hypothetical protein
VGQNFILGQLAITPIIAPAVGLCDGFIQSLVCMVEPCGARVVEVGERALFQFCGGFIFWQDAVGIACDHFGNALHKVGGVEPVFAQLIQPRGGSGDFDRARVGGVVGCGDVEGEAFREGEGFECG